MVLNDIEKEARRLATDVDSLVENLSGVLQSVSGLTVETVQTYRDGVCKTCDEVDSNIRGMYQVGTGDRIIYFILHLPLVNGQVGGVEQEHGPCLQGVQPDQGY